MQLDLSDDERDVLVDLLKEGLGSLREEIYHSTTTDFTARLKKREAALRSLIGKTAGLPPAGGATRRGATALEREDMRE